MKTLNYDAAWIEEALQRLTTEVLEGISEETPLAVIGIRTRGTYLAQRLHDRLQAAGRTADLGELDITLYRDDIHSGAGRKAIQASHIDFDLDGKTVLLVDDVLSTGRTIRAAMSEIMDFGRPACIRLLVLIDRGGQELPIRADYIGATVQVTPGKKLQVRLQEHDGGDGVEEL